MTYPFRLFIAIFISITLMGAGIYTWGAGFVCGLIFGSTLGLIATFTWMGSVLLDRGKP